jgi:hypothetical protein
MTDLDRLKSTFDAMGVEFQELESIGSSTGVISIESDGRGVEFHFDANGKFNHMFGFGGEE